MKCRRQYLFLFVSIVLMLCACVKKKEYKTITMATLLQEMTNRQSLSQFPEPYYVCKQFSSYDRATVSPDDKSWFANWDRSMFIRTENNQGRNEYVMMDTDGPGAIVRFWMTFAGDNSGKGILRIYFDNDSVPAIEGSAFDVISNGLLVGEPLSSSVSDLTKYEMRGHNLYLPLPYAKHCKVTYESENIKDAGAKTGGESVYYNINYRTYDVTTNVETYSKNSLVKYQTEIMSAQQKLQNRAIDLPDNIKFEKLEGVIPSGQSIETSINSSNQAVRLLKFKIDAANLEQALRSTVVRISFDNNTTVNCPIGDFFGTGYQIRKSNTWYTKVEEDGTMSCFWVMPFEENCIIRIENQGTQDVTITSGQIGVAPYDWDDETLYFGASWKQWTRLETGEMKNNEGNGNPFDINYVTLRGKGVYVGDGLTLFNTVYAWWGEGDEKIYVDRDTFPSHIGTGTEDYYGYAWCRPEKFSNHPFIAQPDGSGNFDPGYTVNLRFRSLDAIPFQEKIKLDMEMWHWTKALINFAPVTFWYISPNDTRNNLFDVKEVKEPIVLKRKQLVFPLLINNKIEGENLDLHNKTDGYFNFGNNVEKGWSNNVQMMWRNAKPNSRLELTFESDSEKVADATIVYSKAQEYGRFKISINGKEIVINGSAKEFAIDKAILKGVNIQKGDNKVQITLLSSSNNKENNMVGIDYIEFN